MAHKHSTDSPEKNLMVSPRTMMALAIGVLIMALIVSLGFFTNIRKHLTHRTGIELEHVDGIDHAEVEAPLPPAASSPNAPAPPGKLNHDDTFVIVETMPEMIGGLQAVQSKIQYPKVAKKAGIQGRVFLSFVVEKDGTPNEITVTRGIGGGCDEEAVRALSEMRFTPGLQRGQPVRVQMTLPVTYRLQ